MVQLKNNPHNPQTPYGYVNGKIEKLLVLKGGEMKIKMKKVENRSKETKAEL